MVPKFKFLFTQFLAKSRYFLINFYIFCLFYLIYLKYFIYFFFKYFLYFFSSLFYIFFLLGHKVFYLQKSKVVSSYLFEINFKRLLLIVLFFLFLFFTFFNNFYSFIFQSCFLSGFITFFKLVFNLSYEPFIGVFSEFLESPVFFLSNKETFFSSICFLLYHNFFNYSGNLFFFFDFGFFYSFFLYKSSNFYLIPVYKSNPFFSFFFKSLQFIVETFIILKPSIAFSEKIEYDWFFYQYYHKIFFDNLFVNYAIDINSKSSEVLIKRYSDIALDYTYYSRLFSKNVVLDSIQHFFDIQSLLIFDFKFYNYRTQSFMFDFGLYSCNGSESYYFIFFTLLFLFCLIFLFCVRFFFFFFSFVFSFTKSSFSQIFSVLNSGSTFLDLNSIGLLFWQISERSYFLNKFFLKYLTSVAVYLFEFFTKSFVRLTLSSFFFKYFYLKLRLLFFYSLLVTCSRLTKFFFKLYLFKYFALFHFFYFHYLCWRFFFFIINSYLYIYNFFFYLQSLIFTIFYRNYFAINKYFILVFFFFRYCLSFLKPKGAAILGPIYFLFIKVSQQSYFLLLFIVQGFSLKNKNLFFNTQYFFRKNLSFSFLHFWRFRSTVFFFYDQLNLTTLKNLNANFFLKLSLVIPFFRNSFFSAYSILFEKFRYIFFFISTYFGLIFSSFLCLNFFPNLFIYTNPKVTALPTFSVKSFLKSNDSLFNYVFSSIYYNDSNTYFLTNNLLLNNSSEIFNVNPLSPTFSELFGLHYHAFGGLLSTTFGPVAQLSNFILTNVFYGNINSIYFGFSRPIFFNLNDLVPVWIFSEAFFNILRLAVDPRFFYGQSTYLSQYGLESGPTITEYLMGSFDVFFHKHSFLHKILDLFDNDVWVPLRIKDILPVEFYNVIAPWVISEEAAVNFERFKLKASEIPAYTSFLPERFFDNFLTKNNESFLNQPLVLSKSNYLTKVEGILAFDYDKIVPNLFHYQRMPSIFANRQSYLSPTIHENLNLLYRFQKNLDNKLNFFEKNFLTFKYFTTKSYTDYFLSFFKNYLHLPAMNPQLSAKFHFYNPKRFFAYDLKALHEQFYYKPDFFKNPTLFTPSNFFGKDLEHLFLYYPTLFTVPHSYIFPTTIYNTPITIPSSGASDPLFYMLANDDASFMDLYDKTTASEARDVGHSHFYANFLASTKVNSDPDYNEITGLHKAGILYENPFNQNINVAKEISMSGGSLPFSNVRTTEILTQGGFDNNNSLFFLNFYQGTPLSDFSKFSHDLPFVIPKSVSMEFSGSLYDHPDLVDDNLIFSTRYLFPKSSYLAFEDNSDYSEDFLLSSHFYNYWKESFFDLVTWDIYHFFYDLKIFPLLISIIIQLFLFLFFSFVFYLLLRKIFYSFLFPQYFLMTPFFFFEIYTEFVKNPKGVSQIIFNKILIKLKHDPLFYNYFQKQSALSVLLGISSKYLENFANYAVKPSQYKEKLDSNFHLIKAQIFLLKELKAKSQIDVTFTHHYIQLLKMFFQYKTFFIEDSSLIKKFIFFNTLFSKETEFNRLFKNEIHYGFNDNSLKKAFLKKEWFTLLMQYIPHFDYTYFNFFYDYADTESSLGNPPASFFFNQLNAFSLKVFKQSCKINIPIQLYSFFNNKLIWNYFTWTSLSEDSTIEDDFIDSYFEIRDEDVRASDLVDLQFINLADITPSNYLLNPSTILQGTYSTFDFIIEDSNVISELFFEDIFLDYDSDDSDSLDFLPGFNELFLDFSLEDDHPILTPDVVLFNPKLPTDPEAFVVRPSLVHKLKSQFQFFGDILPSFWSEHYLDFFNAYSTFFTAEPFKDNTFFESNDYIKFDDFTVGEINPYFNFYGEFALTYSLEDSVEDFDLLRDFSENTTTSMLNSDGVGYFPDLSFFRGFDQKSLTSAHRLSFFDDFGDDSGGLTDLNLAFLKNNLKTKQKRSYNMFIMCTFPFFKLFSRAFIERCTTSFNFNKNFELILANSSSSKFWLKVFTKFNQKQILNGKKPLTQNLFLSYYFYLQLAEFLEFDYTSLKEQINLTLLNDLNLIKSNLLKKESSFSKKRNRFKNEFFVPNNEEMWLISQLTNYLVAGSSVQQKKLIYSNFLKLVQPSFFGNLSHNLVFNSSSAVSASIYSNNAIYPDIFETQGSYLFENIDSFSHIYLAFTESSFSLFTEYNKFFFLSSAVQEHSLQNFSEFDLYQKVKFQSFFGFNIFEDLSKDTKYIKKRFTFVLNDFNQVVYSVSFLDNLPFFLKKLEKPLIPFFLFFNRVFMQNWEVYRMNFLRKRAALVTTKQHQFYCKTSFRRVFLSFFNELRLWDHPIFNESLKSINTFQEDLTDYYSRSILQLTKESAFNFEFASSKQLLFCETDFIQEEQQELFLSGLEKDPLAQSLLGDLGFLDSSVVNIYSEEMYNPLALEESSVLLNKSNEPFLKELDDISDQKAFSLQRVPLRLLEEKSNLLTSSVISAPNFLKLNRGNSKAFIKGSAGQKGNLVQKVKFFFFDDFNYLTLPHYFANKKQKMVSKHYFMEEFLVHEHYLFNYSTHLSEFENLNFSQNLTIDITSPNYSGAFRSNTFETDINILQNINSLSSMAYNASPIQTYSYSRQLTSSIFFEEHPFEQLVHPTQIREFKVFDSIFFLLFKSFNFLYYYISLLIFSDSLFKLPAQFTESFNKHYYESQYKPFFFINFKTLVILKPLRKLISGLFILKFIKDVYYSSSFNIYDYFLKFFNTAPILLKKKKWLLTPTVYKKFFRYFFVETLFCLKSVDTLHFLDPLKIRFYSFKKNDFMYYTKLFLKNVTFDFFIYNKKASSFKGNTIFLQFMELTFFQQFFLFCKVLHYNILVRKATYLKLFNTGVFSYPILSLYLFAFYYIPTYVKAFHHDFFTEPTINITRPATSFAISPLINTLLSGKNVFFENIGLSNINYMMPILAEKVITWYPITYYDEIYERFSFRYNIFLYLFDQLLIIKYFRFGLSAFMEDFSSIVSLNLLKAFYNLFFTTEDMFYFNVPVWQKLYSFSATPSLNKLWYYLHKSFFIFSKEPSWSDVYKWGLTFDLSQKRLQIRRSSRYDNNNLPNILVNVYDYISGFLTIEDTFSDVDFTAIMRDKLGLVQKTPYGFGTYAYFKESVKVSFRDFDRDPLRDLDRLLQTYYLTMFTLGDVFHREPADKRDLLAKYTLPKNRFLGYFYTVFQKKTQRSLSYSLSTADLVHPLHRKDFNTRTWYLRLSWFERSKHSFMQYSVQKNISRGFLLADWKVRWLQKLVLYGLHNFNHFEQRRLLKASFIQRQYYLNFFCRGSR